jgi:hypothetical protein
MTMTVCHPSGMLLVSGRVVGHRLTGSRWSGPAHLMAPEASSTDPQLLS